MPNFPVPVSPIRISQALTQPALLQNVGTETIYLDSESSVSPASYGLGLVPRSTVNWPANKELWAMVSANAGNLSVLFNAEGVGLAEVSATIDGDVNIGSPVIIQGGGQNLVVSTGTIAVGGSASIPVPPLASGQTFYAYQISLSITSVPGAAPRIVYYHDSFNNKSVVAMRPSGVLDTEMSFPGRHAFTIPVTANSFDIFLDNVGTLSLDYTLTVSGLNVATPVPTTDTPRILFNCHPVTLTPPTSGSAFNVWIPPTFNGYTLLMRATPNTADIDAMSLSYMNDSGVLETYVTRAYNVGVNTLGINPTDGDFEGANNVYIPIAGNGRTAQISFSSQASNVGNVTLSLV